MVLTGRIAAVAWVRDETDVNIVVSVGASIIQLDLAATA